MKFDVQQHARSAQTALHEALAELARARTAYDNDAGPRFAQAKAAQELLGRKIKAAEGEADAAADAFHAAFASGGFESSDAATRSALNRKNDAQAMAEVMRVAQAKGAKELQALAAEASRQARNYAAAYERAYTAHARAEGYKVLQEAGEAVARAMALAAHAPCSTSTHEDSLGRPPSSAALREEMVAARWAFILDGLKAIAEGLPEYGARPHVEVLGVFDLGALTAQDVLTPAQIHKVRRGGAVVL
jgi:hypothetical protein